MSGDTDDIDASKAPLLDHLIELRNRLLKCVLAFVVAFAITFSFSARIFGFLVQPLVSAYGDDVVGKLIYTKLYEAFFVEIKVAAFAAICLAFPVIANQLWAFVALGVVVVGGILLLLLPAARRLGTDIRLWCLSYGLYVLAVFFPQSSTFRILAPLCPGLGILAAPQSRVYRISLVGAFLIAQFFWLGAAWAVSDYDWTPP